MCGGLDLTPMLDKTSTGLHKLTRFHSQARPDIIAWSSRDDGILTTRRCADFAVPADGDHSQARRGADRAADRAQGTLTYFSKDISEELNARLAEDRHDAESNTFIARRCLSATLRSKSLRCPSAASSRAQCRYLGEFIGRMSRIMPFIPECARAGVQHRARAVPGGLAAWDGRRHVVLQVLPGKLHPRRSNLHDALLSSDKLALRPQSMRSRLSGLVSGGESQ